MTVRQLAALSFFKTSSAQIHWWFRTPGDSLPSMMMSTSGAAPVARSEPRSRRAHQRGFLIHGLAEARHADQQQNRGQQGERQHLGPQDVEAHAFQESAA